MNMKTDSERVTRKAMTLFFVLFLIFGSVLGGLVAVFYRSEIDSFLHDVEIKEWGLMELQGLALENEFDHVTADLLFLSNQNELDDFLMSNSFADRVKVQKEFIDLARIKGVYDQIRFIDASGMERVRVNFDGDMAGVVSLESLQNKSDRYYFKNAMDMGKSGISVSPLDLNVESGVVEQPYKPMIRFGTPVFDSLGKKQGVVILNYLARNLLDKIESVSRTSNGEPMLLNQNGYWMLCQDKELEWGFMLSERVSASFARMFTQEWERMQGQDEGQFQTGNGLFSFRRIYPLREVMGRHTVAQALTEPKKGPEAEYFWVLVSRIAPKMLKAHRNSLIGQLFLFGAALFLMVSLGAWALAVAVTRRRLYQARLVKMALYDPLTSLPNRKLFFDRLEISLNHASRYGRKMGVLYIDLDGFKQVNDTLGHQAGDALLIRVGEILQASSRKSDTVARLGGDEFAVILFEIDGIEGARRAGQKIVESLGEPIALPSGTAHIGGSVGGAVYPDHAEDSDELLKRADSAMYRAKARGKNNCVICSDPPEEG
ncbi:sensor domain-containing diguanylate cyclase [Desulfovibrio ferrophilus]|uniref:Diguanylate cyclase n=1 Tax=Desulfovibrio ferrophilus TaxID=241368 RepID=A0A2Z6AZN3_9BACT|nr:sensor domain-containing diguanylate cyclase [Desulfovibrio ferrophilus]BBD08653.1 diguanylate cyclase [Desulfovibrio ferrophilus]